IGVVSRSDILLHERESHVTASAVPHFYRTADLSTAAPAAAADSCRTVPVSEIMTPVVFSVRPETPALRVIEELRAMKVHRLFVVDVSGVLVGVVSTSDVLRHLLPEEA